MRNLPLYPIPHFVFYVRMFRPTVLTLTALIGTFSAASVTPVAASSAEDLLIQRATLAASKDRYDMFLGRPQRTHRQARKAPVGGGSAKNRDAVAFSGYRESHAASKRHHHSQANGASRRSHAVQRLPKDDELKGTIVSHDRRPSLHQRKFSAWRSRSHRTTKRRSKSARDASNPLPAAAAHEELSLPTFDVLALRETISESSGSEAVATHGAHFNAAYADSDDIEASLAATTRRESAVDVCEAFMYEIGCDAWRASHLTCGTGIAPPVLLEARSVISSESSVSRLTQKCCCRRSVLLSSLAPLHLPAYAALQTASAPNGVSEDNENDGDDQRPSSYWGVPSLASLANAAVYFALVCAVGVLYQIQRDACSSWSFLPGASGASFSDTKLNSASLGDGFDFPLLDGNLLTSAQGRAMCFRSWFCLPYRWADTVDQMSVGSFWPLLLLLQTCWMFSGVTEGVAGVIGLVILVFYRQKLRAAYGMQRGTPQSYAEDFLTWSFCGPCAAVQEARQVESISPP